MQIRSYDASLREELLQLSLRAWRPVFATMPEAVPRFVYDAFYPQGWERRQVEDLGAILDGEPDTVFVALEREDPLGWVAVRIHPSDSMGEIHVLAVDPAHQRSGVATALMDHAFELSRRAGMTMVMVETGGDPGHAPARATYERAGFERWPVARYFRDLTRGPTDTRRGTGERAPTAS